MLSSQDAHAFAVGKKCEGWVDALQSDDKVVQVVLCVRYPRQRWFSRQKKDRKKLLIQCAQLFGPGTAFNVADKQGELFKRKGLSVLVTAYDKGKNAYIEIKMARGGFCG